jgi:hypothetical protein
VEDNIDPRQRDISVASARVPLSESATDRLCDAGPSVSYAINL